MFPSHAAALADWKSYAFRSDFVKVASVKPATALPTPNRNVMGNAVKKGGAVGVPEVLVQFVFGPCLVTAWVTYGGSPFRAVTLTRRMRAATSCRSRGVPRVVPKTK